MTDSTLEGDNPVGSRARALTDHLMGLDDEAKSYEFYDDDQEAGVMMTEFDVALAEIDARREYSDEPSPDDIDADKLDFSVIDDALQKAIVSIARQPHFGFELVSSLCHSFRLS